MELTYQMVTEARERLSGVAHRTPVLTSRQVNERTGGEIFFKAENLQRAGAFKFRGAYNKLASLPMNQRQAGVLAYSSGNHAQAVALSSRLFGIPAVIVMPADAPRIKVEATRHYGAEVVFYDRYTENRVEIGERLCTERGLTMVPPYDDYLVMAGAGTATLELMEEVPDLDELVVCCSGCGLIAGAAVTARHLRPGIRILGVEPESGNDTKLSLERGERVEIPVPRTIADGLAVNTPGRLTFPIVKELVDDILLVSDAELILTIRFILERMKVLVEPSGAAGAAAVLHHKTNTSGRRIGVILSGGNVDPSSLSGYLAESH
ncbi:MAG: threo-3-hydroxy-L-aspartate ammonia-lyase [Acidobacteria bacterium]|nr:threo-3-hydroxy-L-aspartate ammonia-lyase [Acidobacteriota bacterium]